MAVSLIHPTIGRARELQLLDALVRAGGAVVLWGDPGAGKTTLLDHVAGRADAGLLRARGVESEAVLPYATLADLLIPLRPHFADIPAVQRRSLEAALALGGTGTPQPYAVCAAALGVVTAAAEARPLVLLVDDLHLVDESSRRVLLFIARRLGPGPVVLVLTSGDDGDLRARCDVPAMDLPGLSDVECAALLRDRGLEPAPAVLAGLARRTGGNPLALLDWASSLRPAQLTGEEPVGYDLPLGRHLEHAWLTQLHRMPERTRAALTVAAAAGSSTAAVLEAALAVHGLSLADLGPAERAAIVVTGAPGYTFRHPLLRSVVLRRTSLANRLAAFRALAAVTTGTTRAWYLASAANGPDDTAAAALVEAARDARRRSGYDAAARAWHRAAELTTDPARRGALLADAVADAFLGGAATQALSWCDEAVAALTDPGARARVEQWRGRIRTWIGDTAAAHDGLVTAAEAVRAHDPAWAAALLGEAVLPAGMDGRVADAVRRAQDSDRLAREAGADPSRAVVLLGQALTLAGRVPEALDRLDSAAAYLAAADRVADQQLLVLTAHCAGLAGRAGPGRRMITEVIDAALLHSAPAILPVALAVRSEMLCWAGRWAAARADADESLRWARELGQPNALGYTLVGLARLDALRGDRAGCAERVALARHEVGPYAMGSMETYFTAILGLSELASGEYDGAAAQLTETLHRVRRQEMGNPRLVPFAADLVEAHVRGGHPERAADAFDWLVEATARSGLTWAEAVLARCRGLLAPSLEQAQECFAEAHRWHARQDHPFEVARTRLCEGESLRRWRRPAAARGPLHAAYAGFASLGADPWASRAAAELAAAGRRSAPGPDPVALDRLSPQEVQVARAIARGMNNVEAAGALFVSRKTVEAHLTRVYRKLGVRSRTDLTRALVAAGLTD